MKSRVSNLPNCKSCWWRVESLWVVVQLKWMLKMGVSLSLSILMICFRFDSWTALAYSFSLSAAKISSNLFEIEAVFISYSSITTAQANFSSLFSFFTASLFSFFTASLFSFFTAFLFSFFYCLIVVSAASSLSSGFFLGLRFFLGGYATGFTSSQFVVSFSLIGTGFSTVSMILMGSGETGLTFETVLDTCCRLLVRSGWLGMVAVTTLLPTLLGQQPATISVPKCCYWRAESWRWAGKTCELQFCEQLKKPAWQGGEAVKCWDGAYSAAMGQGCGWAAQTGAQRGRSQEILWVCCVGRYVSVLSGLYLDG